MHPDSAGIAVFNVVSERGQRVRWDGQYCTLSPGSRPCLRRFRLLDAWPISSLRISPQTTGWMPIGMRVLMEFFVPNLPSLRVPVDVYGWYRSEWLNPPSWAQNAGGKSGAKMLPCVSLANSCQLARRGILRVNQILTIHMTKKGLQSKCIVYSMFPNPK